MLAFIFAFFVDRTQMISKIVVEKLINAKTEVERKSIIENIFRKDFLGLAQALKDTYYEAWTNEPQRIRKASQAIKTLLKFSPSEEIKALSYWVSGIALLTEGKLDPAIKNLDKAAENFLILNKEHESAQTQVAKLYPLSLLGKYGKAAECGKNALKVFEKYGDELAAGKIENNIGNIYIRQESLEPAKKYYLSARNRFLRLGNIDQLMLSEIGLANVYSALNDFRKAEEYFQKTLSHAKNLGLFLRQAEIETNIGNLALFRGQYNKALKNLENSRQKFESLKMPHQTAIADLEIADAYIELNLANEAFDIYRRVAPQLAEFKIQGEEARSRAQFGRTAILLGEKKTAHDELKKAAKLFQKEKNPVGAAQVKLNQAQFELTEQNYKQALKLAGEAEDLLKDFGNNRHILSAQFLISEAARKLGMTDFAKNHLQKTYTRSISQGQLNIAWMCQNSLGKIAVENDQPRPGEKHFKKAIEIIENLRAPLPAEEFRMAFLADKLAPFEELAKIYLSENKIRRAFEYIELARARTLSESLGATAAKPPTKVSTGLEKKLENLREELNWFYSRLNRADETEFAGLHAEANRREREIADLTRQIGALGGGVSGSPTRKFDLEKLQKNLGAENVLIEYVFFDGEFSAFVVSEKEIRFVRGLGSEDEIDFWLKKLQFQFGAMRYGAQTLKNFTGELKKRTDICLHKLYEHLIRPLEDLTGGKNLVVIPQKNLHYIPFNALYNGNEYLIERREIIFSPSAAVWYYLHKRSKRKPRNALLIGFADEQIPLVEKEIETLRTIFPKAKIFTGERATFAAFTQNAGKFGVLHLACHGQFRAENPMFSSLHLADGWITVRDICSQKINAELVTLSACETGLNKIFAGDEILGLARGFLTAGASSLVLSLWTVSDEATTRLMENFYKNLQRGGSISASLAQAQREFIKENAHPYFWSPFVLIGK